MANNLLQFTDDKNTDVDILISEIEGVRHLREVGFLEVKMKSGYIHFVPSADIERVHKAFLRYHGYVNVDLEELRLKIFKWVREQSGAGPATVKDALNKADWRVDLALEDLRKRGLC